MESGQYGSGRSASTSPNKITGQCEQNRIWTNKGNSAFVALQESRRLTCGCMQVEVPPRGLTSVDHSKELI